MVIDTRIFESGVIMAVAKKTVAIIPPLMKYDRHVHNNSLPKTERIKVLFDNTLQKLSKKDILEKCPDISMSTVEMTLANLLKNSYIIKTGAGRSTAYIRNTDY